MHLLSEGWTLLSIVFLWVDSYLDCGRVTVDDTPFSTFSYGRYLDHFSRGGVYNEIRNPKRLWIGQLTGMVDGENIFIIVF